MENGYLLVKKFGYLKKPTYSWIEVNAQGGSFSNSGQQSSLRKVLDHYLHRGPKVQGATNRRAQMPVKYVEVGYSDDGYFERVISEGKTVGQLEGSLK